MALAIDKLQRTSERLHIDWTLNVTTIGAMLLMVVGWAVTISSQGNRISGLEEQRVSQAIAIKELSSTVQRLDGTLTRLLAQVEERQRLADQRQDRSDFRQDRAELSRK